MRRFERLGTPKFVKLYADGIAFAEGKPPEDSTLEA
jgi:hypothetical protein